jgi:hypothetical protein
MLKVTRLIAVVLVAASAFSCASGPKAANAKTAATPAWVLSPRDSYPESQFLAAVGSGPSRAEAASKAMAALISVFGQSVTSSSTAMQHYAQAAKNGDITVDKSFSVNDTVNASFEYKLILGAEIKETWYDGKSAYYALAAMDKLKSSLAYSQMLEKDSATIEELTSVPEADRNSLETFRRYALAADIADVDGQFVNILSVLSPGAAAASDAKTGATLRAEQMKIGQNLAFSVTVSGDQGDRIKSAIASVITGAGFKTGDPSDSRYAVQAKIDISEITLQGNDNKFARYVLDVQIKDSKSDTVLIPFSDNGRSGQATLAEAENRALRSAETAIKEKLGKAFTDYLATYSK